MKDSPFTMRVRYASIATIAGLLAGCSGGSSVPQATPLGGAVPSSTQTFAYPDFVSSLDAVPLDPAGDAGACGPFTGTAKKTVALPVNGGTVTIPIFHGFTGGATTPPLSAGQGAKVTIVDSTNNFDNQPIPTGQSGVFFTSLTLSQQVTFKTTTIKSNVKSKCLVNGATYTINVYAFGGMVQPTVTAKAALNTVKFSIVVPLGGTFPGGTPADIVLSK